MRGTSFGFTIDHVREKGHGRTMETLTDSTLESIRDAYLRPSLLGAIDGLITSFVIVAGGIAGNVDKSSILVIGFSSLIADGLSMGVSESISSKSQSGSVWTRSIAKGIVCFTSFILFGCFPLLGFLFGSDMSSSAIISMVMFSSFLVLVGVLRAFITKESLTFTVLEVTLLGGVAGGAAFGIASLR